MVNAYVQTHISRRRCKTRRLIRVSTVCLQNFLWFFKKMKISANTPNIWNSLVLSIEIGKFIRLIWVNIQTVYTKSFWDTMITEKWMRNLGIQTGSVKYLCTFLVRKNVIETEINVQVFITIPLRKVTIEQSNSKLWKKSQFFTNKNLNLCLMQYF